MAHKAKNEDHNVKWFHVKSDRPLYRKIHKVEILTATGSRHVVRGADLPDVVGSNFGFHEGDTYLTKIVLRSKSLQNRLAESAGLPSNGESSELPRPVSRYAIRWIIGAVFALMLYFISTSTTWY